jgi:hypothetical protein
MLRSGNQSQFLLLVTVYWKKDLPMMNIMGVYKMRVPNWQHHSKKEQGRTLKPQAMRAAKKRTKQLKRKLLLLPHHV